MNNILVSICCITYNHEEYIENAIEGFLMQKTNFKFEILIHDDASTDKTSDIIRHYAMKYPDIIKPIIQTENQYSKGKKIFPFTWAKATGKYIALCEGDDYWTNPFKLQKQVDFMENHSECSMCFHAAKIIDVTSKNSVGFIKPFNKTFILPNEKLFLGGGHVCPTASILYIKDLMDNPPNLYFECPVGDHAIALVLSNQGRIGYINEVMSVRSLWVPNSWNTIYHDKSNQAKVKHLKGMIKLLKDFNDYSNNKWENDINKTLLAWKIELLSLNGDSKPLKSIECKELIKKLTIINKIKLYARLVAPELYNKLANIRVNFRRHINKIEIEDSGKLKCKNKVH